MCAILHVTFYFVDVVRLLLDSGCDINMTSNRDRTALHMAVWNDRALIAQLLLKAGIEKDTQDRHGDTALMLSARRGFTPILKLLLRAKAKVYCHGVEYDTALHYASRYGHDECLETLLAWKPDLEITNMWGYTPLHFAVMYNHLSVTRTLLKAGADIHTADRSNKTVLHYACKNANVSMVKLLLDQGACPDVIEKDNNTPLMAAIQVNSDEIVNCLIKARANVNFIGKATVAGEFRWCAPLEKALYSNNWVISKMLVLAGSDLTCMRRWVDEGHVPDEVLQDDILLGWIMGTLGSPRLLMDQCRLRIREFMAYDQKDKMEKLPLPTAIQAFLAYRDLDDITKRK